MITQHSWKRRLLGTMLSILLAGLLAAPLAYGGSSGPVKYERHGRFMKRVPETTSTSSTGATVSRAARPAQVTYDKGDLGTYVRHGRFVKRQPAKATASGSSVANRKAQPNTSERAARVVDHIKHRHIYK